MLKLTVSQSGAETAVDELEFVKFYSWSKDKPSSAADSDLVSEVASLAETADTVTSGICCVYVYTS